MTSVSSTTSTGTTSYANSTTSDIDWNALVEVAVQAKLDKADTIDLKITANETKIAAYQQMQSLLQAISDAAQVLRAASGSAGKENDVFFDRSAYLTANGNIDTDNVLSVTVDHGAATGSHDVEVLQLAKAHKVASGVVSGRSEDLGYDGVISLGVDDADNVDIAIDSGMTLDEIAEAINAKTDTTGVQASVIKVANDAYRLVLSGRETGKTITAAAVSGEDVLAALGILDASGGFANELQAAQDAILTVDGIEITRDSNDISDAVAGVSLHLYGTTGSSTSSSAADPSVTVEIGTNLSNVKDAIKALVDAYNAYRDFAYQQQRLTSSGTAANDAVLFGDGTLRNVNSAVADALNTIIDGNSLAILGLSFDETNHLELDEDALDNALVDDLDSVKALLSFRMSTSSTDLMLLARGSSAPASFTLDITVDASGAITAASIDGDSSLFTINGTRIIGKSGTEFAGFAFVYAGDESQSIDVSLSYGMAERLYNNADGAANDTDGALSITIENIENQDKALQTRSNDIRARAETYRATLTARYAKYQTAIAQAESTKSYLEALLDAQGSS